MRIRRAAFCALVFAQVGCSPSRALPDSAPLDDYLFEITDDAAARSSLGSLRQQPFDDGDVELRFWGGYGLRGTSGLILQRRANTWHARVAQLNDCSMLVPAPAADTLSEAAVARIVASLQAQCVDGPMEGSGRVISAHVLSVVAVPPPPALDSLWGHLNRIGLRTLPPRVQRRWAMLDGHSFVIEVRVGSSYRATVIECIDRDRVAADRTVTRLSAALFSAVPTAPWVRCAE